IRNIFASKIQEKLIRFDLIISDDVPPTLILDEVRLRQILFNLIGNAVKFTDNGTITLKVDNKFKLTDRSKIDLIFSVEDTGIGIPKEYQEEIFDSFKQHTHGFDRNYGGTGLGLAITKRLVEMMGGNISVVSDPGVGSIFTVVIKDVSASSLREVAPELSTATKPFFTFSEKIILIADDVKTNRDMLAELFAPTDSSIIFASNGQEAYELSKKHKPDIVFMDIRMPVLDGNHAAKMIREDPDLKNIHIVAITASALKEDIDATFSEYFEGYIIKPVDIFKIIKLTNSLIGEEKELLSAEVVTGTSNDEGFRIKNDISVDEFNARIALDVYPLYTAATKSRLMSDVIAFSEGVRALHQFSGIAMLLSYADELKFAANSFDIELINKNLNSFPYLVEEVREKNISPPEDT
ncbi:MAG: response regulator, partial [Chlorobiota bacterium]